MCELLKFDGRKQITCHFFEFIRLSLLVFNYRTEFQFSTLSFPHRCRYLTGLLIEKYLEIRLQSLLNPL